MMKTNMASGLDPESVIDGPQVYEIVDPDLGMTFSTGHFILEQIRSGKRVLESIEHYVVTLSYPCSSC
ncbi:hypothetical protein Pan110_32250 [Gimesia panareensis]|nr:hypothetical protein Pan110_32250 [Gimesia panareensis]